MNKLDKMIDKLLKNRPNKEKSRKRKNNFKKDYKKKALSLNDYSLRKNIYNKFNIEPKHYYNDYKAKNKLPRKFKNIIDYLDKYTKQSNVYSKTIPIYHKNKINNGIRKLIVEYNSTKNINTSYIDNIIDKEEIYYW